MTIRSLIARFTQQEDLNFLLTNRIPRAALTRFMGWFSKIENPLVRDLSIACWRLFSDLDLSEAKKTEFKSLHDCFTRELRPGLRPADPDPSVVVSPSDGIVGAFGKIADTELFQIKGAPYSLLDLLGDPGLVERHRNGRFLTLRLTSSMYHRFHAPCDGKSKPLKLEDDARKTATDPGMCAQLEDELRRLAAESARGTERGHPESSASLKRRGKLTRQYEARCVGIARAAPAH